MEGIWPDHNACCSWDNPACHGSGDAPSGGPVEFARYDGQANCSGARALMPPQFKPVEPRRLYQQIADQIRELILQGGFDTGTRLPPERDLAQQLGVSR